MKPLMKAMKKIRLSELDNGYEISAVFHNGTEGLMKYSIEYPQISGLDDEAIRTGSTIP